MRSYLQQFSAAVAVLVAMGVAAPAQDLKITKKTTVGEASFSSETLLKGARERTAIQIAGRRRQSRFANATSSVVSQSVTSRKLTWSQTIRKTIL